MNLFGSICLSDIPNDAIKTAANGKKYISLVINERKQPSQYGHTHYIKAYVKKENEHQGVNYFIGDAKVSGYAAQHPKPAAADLQQLAPPQQDSLQDLLPF